MDHPADLINKAIEDLVRRRFELPAFSTLDTRRRTCLPRLGPEPRSRVVIVTLEIGLALLPLTLDADRASANAAVDIHVSNPQAI
jgi:hypothetical protein